MLVKYCERCKTESEFDSDEMKMYGSRSCSNCIRDMHAKRTRIRNYKNRLRQMISSLCNTSINIDIVMVTEVSSAYENRCVVTNKELSIDSNKLISKTSLLPRILSGSVDSSADLVLVSSAFARRLVMQKRQRLDDTSKCCYALFERPETRRRIEMGRLKLQKDTITNAYVTTQEKKRKREEVEAMEKMVDEMNTELKAKKLLLKQIDSGEGVQNNINLEPYPHAVK